MIKESELRDLCKLFHIFCSIKDAGGCYTRADKEDDIVAVAKQDGLVELEAKEPTARERWDAWKQAPLEARDIVWVSTGISLADDAIREAGERSK